MQKGKLVIFSAPSGSGKSTLINHLLECGLDLEFSVSATSRLPRGQEKHGIEYYFFSTEEFRNNIEAGNFLEYEEVYTGIYYGTLKSEVNRITEAGKNVIFDLDVIGGLNIKKIYASEALSVFIAPPGIESLRQRLTDRGTETPEMIEERVGKAAHEMTFIPQFDAVIVNDDLGKAKKEIESIVRNFLGK